MGAIFSGCFTILCMIFLLAFCVQYPAIFWGILAVFIAIIVLGVREGIRRAKQTTPTNPGPAWLKKTSSETTPGEPTSTDEDKSA